MKSVQLSFLHKYLSISSIFIIISVSGWSQDIEFFVPTDKSSEAQSIIYIDGAYFIGGYIEPEGWLYSLPYLIKVNMKGDTVWTRTRMIPGDEQNKDMIVDMVAVNDNLAILASINRLMTILLIDQDGLVKWSYSNSLIENPVSITTTEDDIIVCGSCKSKDVNDGRPSICLLKLDNNGKPLWTTFTGKGERIKPYSLAVTPLGNILVSGRRRKSGSYEAFLLLLDNHGNEREEVSLSEFDIEFAFAIQTNREGDIFVTGEAQSKANPVLVKFDKDRRFQWKHVYDGTSGNFRSYDLSIQDNGDFILVGRTNEAKGFILSADDKGTLKEFRTYKGKEKAGFKSVVKASGDDYACAGLTLQGANQSGMYAVIVKQK
jgi:hypothetical protein